MKKISKYSMLISTILLCGLLVAFLHNLRPKFDDVEKNYKAARAVNLSDNISVERLSDILFANNYVANKKEADLVADTLAARLKRHMIYPNLYFLQKRAYGKIPALVADSLGVFEHKLERSYEAIGVTKDLPSPLSLDSIKDLGNKDGGRITVQLHSKTQQDFSNALVRLTAYYLDSLNQAHIDTLAILKTNSAGVAVFSGLNKAYGYSVLPIKKEFEYGSSKGVKYGKFKSDLTFRFEQLEHRLQMIDNATLKQIKNDGTITVRTPVQYKSTVIKWFIIILLAWWFLAIVLVRLKRNFDPLLIAAVMFLTGLCVIIMFAVQNPLTEELRGVEMASGVLIGMVFIIAFQFVDFIKFYQGRSAIVFDPTIVVLRWLFLPFKQKVSKLSIILTSDARIAKKLGAMLLLVCCFPFAIFNIPKISNINKPILRLIDCLPKGFGWLLLAIFITALLFPFGKDVGGMTVNLSLMGLTFQPSEIAKYLILFFMAAFFTNTADTIIAYSRPNHTNIRSKVRTLFWLIVGLLSLMIVYAGLGDMGPGLVIAVTFIFLYSLIKSKVNLENLSDDKKWERIFTCDFAMLIYGIVSFALFTFIGYKLHVSLLFAILWFIVWIGGGYLWHKQLFETPIFFNMMVFLVIFGGEIILHVPGLEDNDTAKRFEQRTLMCMNTWGDWEKADGEDFEEAKMAAVSNTQVANGLWAIATGGLFGQGLGEGNPNLIPAFHTDMILSSIAEQTGWWGLVLVVLALAVLLRRMIVVGYQVGHPFAFYLCSGVAIVTAVQFFIIALGSSGIIPLTGITVPFLSYGRVSMVLNLAAFGVVLSLTKNVKNEQLSEVQEKIRLRSVGDYNFPISIATWSFIILAVFTLCVWQYYALWTRNKTLVKPAFVYNKEGVPVIEYNPRISLLTREMWAGNIYDRNGVLLATSDQSKFSDNKVSAKILEAGIDSKSLDSVAKPHTRRYYPFGEHMFFMLGDWNSGLYFYYYENNPIGYMAEKQHATFLRNINTNPQKVKIKGRIKTGSRYLDSESQDKIFTNTIYNYDDKELIKILKKGIHGRPLKDHNQDVRDGNFDLHLTVDASLQVDMQNRFADYVKKEKNLKNNNLLRISAVVLDAQNGDLLTSANYPLPSYTRLKDEDLLGHKSYLDYYKDTATYKGEVWSAYTDRDLALTYQTAPGSTAKVMSALAGLNCLGVDRVRKEAIFPVYRYEVIDIKEAKDGKLLNSKEPPMGFAPMAMVSMEEAIKESSNCYFINLIHKYGDCYNELENIYSAAGLSVGAYPNNKKTYSFHYEPSNELHNIVMQQKSDAVIEYEKYIAKRDAGEIDPQKTRKRMKQGVWQWAWGQGTLEATPLSMARVVSAVINGGKMPVTQYLLKTADKSHKKVTPEYVQISTKDKANELKKYMRAQASKHGFDRSIGGKTGTPERPIKKIVKQYNKKSRTYEYVPIDKRPNDGWYVFYIETNKKEHPILAVALRMERINDETSGAAMKMAKSEILSALHENGYMN